VTNIHEKKCNVIEQAPNPECIVPEISIHLSRRGFWDLTPPPPPPFQSLLKFQFGSYFHQNVAAFKDPPELFPVTLLGMGTVWIFSEANRFQNARTSLKEALNFAVFFFSNLSRYNIPVNIFYLNL